MRQPRLRPSMHLLLLVAAAACAVDYGLEDKEFGNQGADDPDPDPPLDTGLLSPVSCY